MMSTLYVSTNFTFCNAGQCVCDVKQEIKVSGAPSRFEVYFSYLPRTPILLTIYSIHKLGDCKQFLYMNTHSRVTHFLLEPKLNVYGSFFTLYSMKERLFLEAERLGLNTVVMGSEGFGASKRSAKGMVRSVSDYCVHHCVFM